MSVVHCQIAVTHLTHPIWPQRLLLFSSASLSGGIYRVEPGQEMLLCGLQHVEEMENGSSPSHTRAYSAHAGPLVPCFCFVWTQGRAGRGYPWSLTPMVLKRTVKVFSGMTNPEQQNKQFFSSFASSKIPTHNHLSQTPNTGQEACQMSKGAWFNSLW